MAIGFACTPMNHDTDLQGRYVNRKPIVQDGLIREMKHKKIRVLHIITRFLRGGGAINTLFTVQELDKYVYEVHLAVGRDIHKPQIKKLEKVTVFQVTSLVRNVTLISDIRSLICIYKYIRKNDFDIVHTHLAKAGFIGRLAAKAAGVPIIIHTIHGITFPPAVKFLYRCYYIFLEKIAAKWTDQFISVGEDLKKSYLGKGIGNSNQYQIIRSGMDLHYFKNASGDDKLKEKIKKELRINNDEKIIGYVSNLESRKGHIYAIQAAEIILKKHINSRFLFVGEGYLNEKIENYIYNIGLEKKIQLLGYRKDVAEIMSIFDIKIFTSMWEGLPQVLVQAAAMGIPIVSFDTDGVSEIVIHGKNGYIVDKKDTQAMAKFISTLLSNPQKSKTMGMHGVNIIDAQWEKSTMITKISHLYSQLYNGSV